MHASFGFTHHRTLDETFCYLFKTLDLLKGQDLVDSAGDHGLSNDFLNRFGIKGPQYILRKDARVCIFLECLIGGWDYRQGQHVDAVADLLLEITGGLAVRQSTMTCAGPACENLSCASCALMRDASFRRWRDGSRESKDTLL